MALLQASSVFEKLELEGDEATGANAVKLALEAPLKQIAVNGGLEGGVIVEKVRNLPVGHGLNAATGEYVDMIAEGIIDPAKVTRSALQNAASIAALFLTTEAVIADKPEKAGAGAAPVAACRAVTWTSDRPPVDRLVLPYRGRHLPCGEGAALGRLPAPRSTWLAGIAGIAR